MPATTNRHTTTASMTLRRIFSEQPLATGRTISLGSEAAHHVSRVLRMQPGDSLLAFDGSGRDFSARIVAIRRADVQVAVGSAVDTATESPAHLTLMQGVCRGSRMDTVIQKATELGVRRIEPVLGGRSVVRLDAGQREQRRQHWRQVAISACEQCGRSRIPDLAPPRPLPEALAERPDDETRLLLAPDAAATLTSVGPLDRPIALLIGPEGGLTPEERELALSRGFRGVRLGPRILRTETAPLAALAILQFLAGDLDRLP